MASRYNVLTLPAITAFVVLATPKLSVSPVRWQAITMVVAIVCNFLSVEDTMSRLFVCLVLLSHLRMLLHVHNLHPLRMLLQVLQPPVAVLLP